MGGVCNTMVKVAYIFPGQGAQYAGMGKSLYDSFPEARKVFDESNDILGFDIKKICFEGSVEELSRTSNCQPAIMIHSIAALRVLESIKTDFEPACTLGMSVGEYVALVASGACGYADGLTLMRKRAVYMEEASEANPGGMAAVLSLAIDKVEEACSASGAQVANLNCTGQVVISGGKDALEKACAKAKEMGAARVIPLNVSGAFHSALMDPAAERVKKEFELIELKKPFIPMVCNVNPAVFESDTDRLKKNLIAQINNRTLWEESVRFVAASGVKAFIEIGPGRVLKGILKRIDRSLEVRNIDTAEDLGGQF